MYALRRAGAVFANAGALKRVHAAELETAKRASACWCFCAGMLLSLFALHIILDITGGRL